MEDDIKKLVSLTSWFISVQVMTMAALLVIGGIIYKDIQNLKVEFSGAASAAESSRRAPNQRHIAQWQDYIRPHNATIGSQDADIVIVEFTDFQCPFCKSFNDNTRGEILTEYRDNIRFVFKHYPLEQIHPQARLAAVATQCALREDSFEEVKDLFFSQKESMTEQSLIQAGQSVDLKADYATCVRNRQTQDEVDQDIDDAMDLGVQGTPTFLINGELVVGALSLAQVKRIVAELE